MLETKYTYIYNVRSNFESNGTRKQRKKKKRYSKLKLVEYDISFYRFIFVAYANPKYDDLYLNLDGLANRIQENSRNFFISRNHNL